MARKPRRVPAAPPPGPAPAASLPSGEAGTGLVALLLALTIFLAPALGVPNEEMLQDTLKSIVVSFGALGAGLAFFWAVRRTGTPLRWHGMLWLPIALLLYALGSIAWSHAALASTEAIRWFIFALVAFLALNTFSRERLPLLALGIHGGAVVASLWAVLQFLADFSIFPQGPNPASTFVNRNFFAEFAICTLPFSLLLVARAKRSSSAVLLAASAGIVIAAVLMTGTRAALMSLWVQLLVVLPAAGWLYRGQLELPRWPVVTRVLAVVALVGVVAGLGAIPTGNPSIAQEGRGLTGLERGMKRTGSISPQDPSLGVRMVMWKATAGMIAKRPISGVGAGAWENDIPLYQAEGAQLETDYYVHNEFLQIVAEYGLVGWFVIAALFAWLLDAFRRTVTARGELAQAEGPWRAVLLTSLLSLFIVSNVGFAWRMASTGALFALCLGALAASDARLNFASPWLASRLPWRRQWAGPAVAVTVVLLAIAAAITQLAAEAESKIVRATKIALTISASGQPNDARWDRAKAEMLRLVDDGIAIDPHYRKITPIVADELARWGDWKDAIPIWESVLSSRPHIVAILSNVARGYYSLGDFEKAQAYLSRARAIQPKAPSVRSLEVLVLARKGDEAQALALGKQAIADNVTDLDLLQAVYVIGRERRDFPAALQAAQLQVENYPFRRVQGWIELGVVYGDDLGQAGDAVSAYANALSLVRPADRDKVLEQVPPALRARVVQMSASKG